MSFILKLINSPDDTSYYEIKYNLHNTMTLKLLYELFNFLGLSFDDLIIFGSLFVEHLYK